MLLLLLLLIIMIMIHDDVLKILLERKAKAIDLFTDMADILNLLNLRNIM